MEEHDSILNTKSQQGLFEPVSTVMCYQVMSCWIGFWSTNLYSFFVLCRSSVPWKESWCRIPSTLGTHWFGRRNVYSHKTVKPRSILTSILALWLLVNRNCSVDDQGVLFWIGHHSFSYYYYFSVDKTKPVPFCGLTELIFPICTLLSLLLTNDSTTTL